MLRPLLGFDISLQRISISCKQRATVTQLIGRPKRVNSSAIARVDLLVHFSKAQRIAAVVSSTIRVSWRRTSGSTSSTFFLPPPAFRTCQLPEATVEYVPEVRHAFSNRGARHARELASRLTRPVPVRALCRHKQACLKFIQRAQNLPPTCGLGSVRASAGRRVDPHTAKICQMLRIVNIIV